jgi:hypothetical protein
VTPARAGVRGAPTGSGMTAVGATPGLRGWRYSRPGATLPVMEAHAPKLRGCRGDGVEHGDDLRWEAAHADARVR